jgi:hypothetical protein
VGGRALPQQQQRRQQFTVCSQQPHVAKFVCPPPRLTACLQIAGGLQSLQFVWAAEYCPNSNNTTMHLTDFTTNTTFIFSPQLPEDLNNSTLGFSMNFTEVPPPPQMPISLNFTEEAVPEPMPVYQPSYKIPQGGSVAQVHITLWLLED